MIKQIRVISKITGYSFIATKKLLSNGEVLFRVKAAYLKEIFAECGEHSFIEVSFYAPWDGSHVHFGSRIYANYNLTLIDDGHIYIGDRVLLAPNVTIVTASHRIETELRGYEMQYIRDVHIGENTWICTGVIVLPGVTIGKTALLVQELSLQKTFQIIL